MKFMIMNYKPYEYELLQTKLNKLGQPGYITQDYHSLQSLIKLIILLLI